MTDSARSQRLPGIELAACLVCFTGLVATAGYTFVRDISHESILQFSYAGLRDGFLGMKMDNTYQDFNLFLANFWFLILALAGHLLVSQVTLRFCNLQIHHLACAAFTLAVSGRMLSANCAALFLGLHCGIYLAGLTGSHLAVWAVGLLAFVRFTGPYIGNADLRRLLKLDDRGLHLFYPISGYLGCRFLAMGLCVAAPECGSAQQNPQAASSPSQTLRLLGRTALRRLPESLHYAFYLPNFLGAPMVTMADFLAQRRATPQRLPRLGTALLRLCRLVLWLGVTLAIVHWFPVGAYLDTVDLRAADLRKPVAYGHVTFAMYARGQLFMLEYVQFYGWPALFAALDGVNLPHWPACICRVASFREMWRLFDRGLFSIVREHIYIPLGGSRRGLGRQLVATAACFGFICMYHGNYESVQVWILVNLALVSVEIIAVRAYKGWLEAKLLRWASPRWIRRLTGCVAALNLIPPSMGIFCFFYGIETGKLLMREVLLKPLTGQSSIAHFGMFYASIYCSVQLAIEYKIRRGPENKD